MDAFALLGFEALGGLQVRATEAEQVFLWQNLLDGGGVVVGEVSVLVKLGLEPLHFLEMVDEGGAGVVALEVGHGFRSAGQALGFHKGVQLLNRALQLSDDHGGFVHEPDFAGFGHGTFPREESDGGIHGILLLAKVEDIAVGLRAIEHAVGAGEGLDQTVMLEVLVHIKRVQVFGIEAGQQHVHHDGDIDFLRMGQVGVGPLLVLDALLHILIVEIELSHRVIGAKARVVVGEDGLEGFFFLLRLDGVVLLFLRQIFLNLLHILVALGGRGEDASDIQRLEVKVGGLFLGLKGLEKGVVFDGVIDGGGGKQCIEPTPASGGIVLGQNGVNNGAFGEALAGLGSAFSLGLEVVHMEAQDVCVLDGVGDGVGVELLLENVHRGLELPHLPFKLLGSRVHLKDGGAGEAKELGLREEFLDGLVVLAEL